MTQTPTPQNIAQVIEREQIAVLFQPVVSVQAKSIVGFEAFSRGIEGAGVCLDARALFDTACDPATRLKLCRLCRRKALESFRPIGEKHPRMQLFLNVDGAALSSVTKFGYLEGILTAMGIQPRQVVVELERPGLEAPQVAQFVEHYRRLGCRVSLDAIVGANVPAEEFHTLRPDYIKIDRQLYTDADGRDYKRELVRSLSHLAEGLGGILVAKGVETEEEAIRLLEWGVGHQQGYYYTRDPESKETDPIRSFLAKVEEINRKYRERAQAEVAKKRKRYEEFHKTLKAALYKAAGAFADDLPGVLERIVAAEEGLFCACVLNDDGVQLTPKAFKRSLVDQLPQSLAERGRGEDHSLKDYVVHLKCGFEKFVTQPVVSPYAKVPTCCITARFFGKDGSPLILLLEFLCG